MHRSMLFEHGFHRTVQQGAIPLSIDQPGIDFPVQVPGAHLRSVTGIHITNELPRRNRLPTSCNCIAARAAGDGVLKFSTARLNFCVINKCSQRHAIGFQVTFCPIRKWPT
jgi:hypothetical protein